MNPTARSGAPGVSLGYLTAGALAAALWLGIGVILIPAMLVLALVHGFATGNAPPVPATHHRWLARHHSYSALALLLVLVAPLFALPGLIETARTIFNTLTCAPHPIATLRAALPQLGLGPLLVFAFIALAGWLLVTLWISVRLIRRGLRWAEGLAA